MRTIEVCFTVINLKLLFLFKKIIFQITELEPPQPFFCISSSCFRNQKTEQYTGHYILLCGYDVTLEQIFYRNPAYKDRNECFLLVLLVYFFSIYIHSDLQKMTSSKLTIHAIGNFKIK